MLPSSLRSTYQQYKADTDSVATWLATTARANGYSDPNSGNPPAKSGRLKGKARKKQQQPQPTNAAPKKVHILRIKDFEPMASYVAGIESVKVPDYLTVALERVIWGTYD